MGCNLAIAGVTGAVGQEFLTILEERDFPFDSLKMLASSRSAGKKIMFKNKEYIVEELGKDSFEGIDIVLFSAGGSRRKEFAPAAVQAGAVVVDNAIRCRLSALLLANIIHIHGHDQNRARRARRFIAGGGGLPGVCLPAGDR